jgi:hypothetical protein
MLIIVRIFAASLLLLQSQIQHSITSMGQMMPKQPLIIIIWTYQETMAWMSSKSIGILGVGNSEDFCCFIAAATIAASPPWAR